MSITLVVNIDQVKQAYGRLAVVGAGALPTIGANREQIDTVVECGTACVETHIGHYANASDEAKQHHLLRKINDAKDNAHNKGLQFNAGHGLNYHNVQANACTALINELKIGQTVIAEFSSNDLTNSPREMKRLMLEARL